MPFYSEIIDRDLTLGVWQVTESLDELSEQFDFPTYWGERFTSFSSDGRKIEFLAVRLLLKVLCGEEKEIAYLASGRPYLVMVLHRLAFRIPKDLWLWLCIRNNQ